jgi:putative transposase
MPIPEKYLAQFERGKTYHIFNRSIGNRLLFREEDNYHYFLSLLQDHLIPGFDFFACCLIPNHFHLLARVKESDKKHKEISNHLRSFFIAYTNAVNKMYNERGGLFQTPFRRTYIDSDIYFNQVVHYIHWNPVHHNICRNCDGYKWSSYKKLLSGEETFLERDECIQWFGGEKDFIKYHSIQRPLYM